MKFVFLFSLIIFLFVVIFGRRIKKNRKAPKLRRRDDGDKNSKTSVNGGISRNPFPVEKFKKKDFNDSQKNIIKNQIGKYF